MSSVTHNQRVKKYKLNLLVTQPLSLQKVNLCFIYLESASCIKKIEAILEEATPPPAPESQQQNGGPKNFLEKTRDQIFGNQNGFDRDTYLRVMLTFFDLLKKLFANLEKITYFIVVLGT